MCFLQLFLLLALADFYVHVVCVQLPELTSFFSFFFFCFLFVLFFGVVVVSSFGIGGLVRVYAV